MLELQPNTMHYLVFVQVSPTVSEGSEGEVWQVAAQLCVAGRLFELPICFTGIILKMKILRK